MVGYKKPSNKIVVKGEPFVQELKIETVTKCLPGRLVKKGTNDDDVVVNTAAGKAIGWLGYEQAAGRYQPATVDTIYKVSDWVPVLNGPVVLVGSLADGQTVVKGDALVGAADGEVKLASAISATVPADSTAVLSTSAQPAMTMAGGLPAEGPIVGYAEESKAASGSSEDLIIRNAL